MPVSRVKVEEVLITVAIVTIISSSLTGEG